MRQIPLYSLVIFPNPEQITLIKSYKQLLRNNIGWFGSANAGAHITIINFDNEFSLQLHLDSIREFCKTALPQKVTLNKFDSFGERTFFIASDSASQHYLDNLIVGLHQYLDFKIQNTHAHLSIARGLDAQKMKTAFELFRNTPINLEFNCNCFYLRRFGSRTKPGEECQNKIRNL
ncbi:2'-5' RNA ligase family protein [Flavobacterium aestuarii]|uniref:2'-5' RNA ligase family protein n=1 Tax=Flavobacterium aestuarii TaxID=3149227 RepID=UPI0032B3FB7F